MGDPPEPITVPCTQCGGPLEVRDEEPFVRCRHCDGTLFLDLSAFVIHRMVRPRVERQQAAGALERFLHAAEVGGAPEEVQVRALYLPWWRIPRPGDLGPALLPAAAHGEDESLENLREALVGDLEPFDVAAAREAEIEAPSISLEEAVARAGEGALAEGARLVHVPYFEVSYGHGPRRYVALIDALEGAVTTDALPPSASRRLDWISAILLGLAIALFSAEAAILPGVGLPLLAFALTGFGIYTAVKALERSLLR